MKILALIPLFWAFSASAQIFDGSLVQPNAPGPATGGSGVTSVSATAPITSTGGATPVIALADSGVTYAKIQNVSATDRVLGRSSAGAGVIEEIPLTAAGRALIDDADASAQRLTLGLGTMAIVNSPVPTANGGTGAASLDAAGICQTSGGSHATMSRTTLSGTSPTIDFAAASVFDITLSGNTSFAATGMAVGRHAQVFVSAGGSTRTLSFPGWIFLDGTAPSAINANKTALLYVACDGTTSGSCVASWGVQP